MKDNLKEAKETLRDLIIGIILCAVILIAASMILLGRRYSIIFGIGLGAIGAAIVAIHMFYSLNKSLDLGEEDAIKRERVMAVIRMVIMGLVAVIGIIFPQYFHVLGIFAGLLSLKISAYLQPLLHNYILKPKEKGEGR